MRIVPYDQLNDPYGFIKLMEPAFGWTPEPQRIRRWRRLDVRYRSPFGFAALEGDTPVGFVGVMDFPVRTLDRGVETAGGIHAVATDPNCRRAGTATRLLQHAHRHFRKQGYRFSFLCTARSLVAFNLYVKLGYVETPFVEGLKAMRFFRPRKERKQRRPKKLPPVNTRRVTRLFADVIGDRPGFSARIDGWARMLIDSRELKPENTVVRPDGYAFVAIRRNALHANEIVARDLAAYEDLLEQLKKYGKPVMVFPFLYDPVLEGLLRRRGFVFRAGRYFTVMCKPLAGTPFDRAFGNRFYFSGLDDF